MSVQTDAEAALVAASTICNICHGGKNIIDPKSGLNVPCRCVEKARMIKHLGALKKAKLLTSTPLQKYIMKNQNLVIEFDDPLVLRSHIKSALVYRNNLDKTWLIVTPDEVMSRSFSSDLALKRSIYEVDLLIILAPAFPHYEKASSQHDYVLQARLGLGKVTWFCTGAIEKLFIGPGMQVVPSLTKYLLALDRVQVTRKNTTRLLRERTNTPTIEKSGMTLTSVDQTLLDTGIVPIEATVDDDPEGEEGDVE